MYTESEIEPDGHRVHRKSGNLTPYTSNSTFHLRGGGGFDNDDDGGGGRRRPPPPPPHTHSNSTFHLRSEVSTFSMDSVTICRSKIDNATTTTTIIIIIGLIPPPPPHTHRVTRSEVSTFSMDSVTICRSKSLSVYTTTTTTTTTIIIIIGLIPPPPPHTHSNSTFHLRSEVSTFSMDSVTICRSISLSVYTTTTTTTTTIIIIIGLIPPPPPPIHTAIPLFTYGVRFPLFRWTL